MKGNEHVDLQLDHIVNMGPAAPIFYAWKFLIINYTVTQHLKKFHNISKDKLWIWIYLKCVLLLISSLPKVTFEVPCIKIKNVARAAYRMKRVDWKWLMWYLSHYANWFPFFPGNIILYQNHCLNWVKLDQD